MLLDKGNSQINAKKYPLLCHEKGSYNFFSIYKHLIVIKKYLLHSTYFFSWFHSLWLANGICICCMVFDRVYASRENERMYGSNGAWRPDTALITPKVETRSLFSISGMVLCLWWKHNEIRSSSSWYPVVWVRTYPFAAGIKLPQLQKQTSRHFLKLSDCIRVKIVTDIPL